MGYATSSNRKGYNTTSPKGSSMVPPKQNYGGVSTKPSASSVDEQGNILDVFTSTSDLIPDTMTEILGLTAGILWSGFRSGFNLTNKNLIIGSGRALMAQAALPPSAIKPLLVGLAGASAQIANDIVPSTDGDQRMKNTLGDSDIDDDSSIVIDCVLAGPDLPDNTVLTLEGVALAGRFFEGNEFDTENMKVDAVVEVSSDSTDVETYIGALEDGQYLGEMLFNIGATGSIHRAPFIFEVVGA